MADPRGEHDRKIDDLALRFHDGDPEAVRELYRAVGSAAYAVAYRVLENRSHAEDAVQQAFLAAWKARATLDPSRGIRLWLFAIVKRCALDALRRERLRTHTNVDDAVAHPALADHSVDMERVWETWKVREAVDRLPAEERDVVRLQHFGGYTHPEIAERLGVPVGTVKSRSHRAHRRLVGHLSSMREVPSAAGPDAGRAAPTGRGGST